MTFSKLPFNISPKVAYLILSTIVTWALTHYAAGLDPEVATSISLAIGGLVGYKASPGDVVERVGDGSDDRLSPDVKAKLV